MTTTSRWRTRLWIPAAWWLACSMAGVVLTGCEKGPRAEARGEPDAIYTVRARVEMVPRSGQATSEFVIHHEAIPAFRNPDGSVGMNAMMMPTPLGTGVTLEGVEVGDVVEVTLAVWTTPGKRGYEARKVVELPGDTALDLGKP